MSCFPPLNIELDGNAEHYHGRDPRQVKWKFCVSHALKVAAVYQLWSPDGKADPMMLPITWMATCILIFELMNPSPVLGGEKHTVLDSVDLLMCKLDQSSQSWGIVSALMRKFNIL